MADGPIATLQALGFDVRPSWFKGAYIVDKPKGDVLHANPDVLGVKAIRALAALSFEGYEIKVYGNGQELELTIQKNNEGNTP